MLLCSWMMVRTNLKLNKFYKNVCLGIGLNIWLSGKVIMFMMLLGSL